MAARANRTKVSLDDRIDILNKNTTRVPPAKEVLTIASGILTLVRVSAAAALYSPVGFRPHQLSKRTR